MDWAAFDKLWEEVKARRIKLADENRANGIPDPLNTLVDSLRDLPILIKNNPKPRKKTKRERKLDKLK